MDEEITVEVKAIVLCLVSYRLVSRFGAGEGAIVPRVSKAVGFEI